MTKWAYSTDQESYTGTFETPEEAIREAVLIMDACRGEVHVLWIAEVDYEADRASEFLPSVHRILDTMDDDASDHFPPESAARHFSDASEEAIAALERKLRAAVDQWATEYRMHPRWFTVDRPREVEFDVAGDDERTLRNAVAAWKRICQGCAS